MNRNKLLLFGGVGLVGVGVVWFVMGRNTSSAGNTGTSNAVNPQAQVGGGLPAQGTMPDIGNLLSYNNPVGSVSIIPQATSVDPFSGNYGQWATPTFGLPTTLPNLGSPSPVQQFQEQ